MFLYTQFVLSFNIQLATLWMLLMGVLTSRVFNSSVPASRCTVAVIRNTLNKNYFVRIGTCNKLESFDVCI